jgi:hypothetical protein
MSDSTYDHYGSSGPMPQQPKFKDCVWNSDKDPYTSFRTWLCVFGGIVANYPVGPQLERFLDLFLVRDPQAATTQPSFLSDPRLSLGEPSGAYAQGSNVTRHQSPLSMGGRSEATGETLGSEVRSTTSHDDDEHESGEGLPSIPEGEEGPLSPDSNATVSEADQAISTDQDAEVPWQIREEEWWAVVAHTL